MNNEPGAAAFYSWYGVAPALPVCLCSRKKDFLWQYLSCLKSTTSIQLVLAFYLLLLSYTFPSIEEGLACKSTSVTFDQRNFTIHHPLAGKSYLLDHINTSKSPLLPGLSTYYFFLKTRSLHWNYTLWCRAHKPLVTDRHNWCNQEYKIVIIVRIASLTRTSDIFDLN